MPEPTLAYLRALLHMHVPAARSERGATATEYAILVGFIAVLLIGAALFFSGRIGDAFSRAGNSLGA